MDIEKLKVTLKSRVAKGLNYGIEAVYKNQALATSYLLYTLNPYHAM